MKTVEDVVKIWDKAIRDEGGSWGKAIADAWNADIEEMGRNAGYYKSMCAKYLETGARARKQLRKLRNELGEAKALCGVYHMQVTAKIDMVGRLERLIVQIARGAK